MLKSAHKSRELWNARDMKSAERLKRPILQRHSTGNTGDIRPGPARYRPGWAISIDTMETEVRTGKLELHDAGAKCFASASDS
jgi:hypothetical protein